MEQNKSPEKDPHKYSRLIIDKEAKAAPAGVAQWIEHRPAD